MGGAFFKKMTIFLCGASPPEFKITNMNMKHGPPPDELGCEKGHVCSGGESVGSKVPSSTRRASLASLFPDERAKH